METDKINLNKATLINRLQELWDILPQTKMDSLIQSFDERLNLLEEAKGQSIQPILSPQKKTIPENYFGNVQEFHPWTKEEDAILLEKVQVH